MSRCRNNEMMRAALEGVTRQDGTKPIVVVVTQLTNKPGHMNHELLIPASMEETVLHYAKCSEGWPFRIVCSPLEAEIVKTIGNNFVTITPGIRLANAMKDDQVRVSTPEQAKRTELILSWLADRLPVQRIHLLLIILFLMRFWERNKNVQGRNTTIQNIEFSNCTDSFQFSQTQVVPANKEQNCPFIKSEPFLR